MLWSCDYFLETKHGRFVLKFFGCEALWAEVAQGDDFDPSGSCVFAPFPPPTQQLLVNTT